MFAVGDRLQKQGPPGKFRLMMTNIMMMMMMMMLVVMLMMMTKMAMIRIVTTAGVGSCDGSLGGVRNTPDTRDAFLPVSLYYYGGRDDDHDNDNNDYHDNHDNDNDDDDGKGKGPPHPLLASA